MTISPESQQRLIRFALAVQEVERTERKIFYKDGSRLNLGPSLATWTEYAVAKTQLSECPELEIKQLLYVNDLARVDEAMADESKTAADILRADDDATLAKNELIAMGWKFKAEQDGKPATPRKRRRRENARRNRRCRSNRC